MENNYSEFKIFHFKYGSLGPCESFIQSQLDKQSTDAGKFFVIRRNDDQRETSMVTLVLGWSGYLKLLFGFQPDKWSCIHAHFLTNALLMIPLSAIYKTPLVVSGYGHDVFRFPNKNFGFNKLLIRFLGFYCSQFLVYSRAMADTLQKLGIPENKIKIYHPGIVGLPFQRKKVRSLQRLLMISSLRPKKNHRMVLEALALLAKKGENFELLIVGEGPEYSDLVSLSKQLELQDRVQFRGHVNDLEEIVGLYQSADLFLHPSRTAEDGDSEGVPTSILEALSAGMPVVTTRHAGLDRVFGSACLYTEENCPEALASLLLDLRKGVDKLEAMQERALRKFEDFRETNLDEELRSIYSFHKTNISNCSKAKICEEPV